MAYRCIILNFSQREQEGAGADEDEDDAHDPHEDFGGEDLAELGGEGGGNDAPKDEAGDDLEVLQLDKNKEGDGLTEGDKKFGQVDGADDVAGLVPLGEQGGGDDGSPTPSAHGIEKAPGGGEGDGLGGFRATTIGLWLERQRM